ncbi:hypothetical protein SDC9_193358 [bioreactor metagenome]|uniref:Uncharacterized protein n=1 Tax=bioreactor metagenome TaxID=1076179 RepID=A0A645I4J0_9ZZZZ
MFEPLHFFAGTYKKLHFHLLELPDAEDELTGYNLVAESFTNLGDTERNLHTTGFLYVQVVHKNTLSRFGAQVDFHCAIGS